MTKASITKKTLSVFLSLLMIMSCCITAFPSLADTFGLRANAGTVTSAHKTALDNALNVWAANKNNNNRFHVAEALAAVLNDYVNIAYGTGTMTTTQNVWAGGDTTDGNFLADIRSLLAGYYTSNSEKYNLLLELIPAAKKNDDRDSANRYVHHETYYQNIVSQTPSQDVVDTSVSTETKTATRNRVDALADYILSSFPSTGYTTSVIPSSVYTTYTITYPMAARDHTSSVWGSYSVFSNGYHRQRGAYYYFSAKPSGALSNSQSISDIKSKLDNFYNRFGQSSQNYASASMKTYIDDYEALYKLGNTAASRTQNIDYIVADNASVYSALVNTYPSSDGYTLTTWTNLWNKFFNSGWVTNNIADFIKNSEAAKLANDNKADIASLNACYADGTIVTPENLDEQTANYDTALQLYNTLRDNLDSSKNTTDKAIKDIAVSQLQRLSEIDSAQEASELRAWSDYAQYLADLRENVERCGARVLKEKIVDLLDELAPTYVGPSTAEDVHLFRQTNEPGEDLPVLTDERLQTLSVEIKTHYAELSSYDSAVVKYVFEEEGLYFVPGKEDDDAYKFAFADVLSKIGELNREATIRHYDPEITDLMAYYQHKNAQDLTLYSVKEATLRADVDEAIENLARANEIFNLLKNGDENYVAVGEAVALAMFLDRNSDPATDLRTELQNLINKLYDRMVEKMKEDAEAVYALFTAQGSEVNIQNFKMIQSGINALKANDDDFYKYLLGQEPYEDRDMARTREQMNAVRGNPYFVGENSANYAQTVAGLYQWLKVELKNLCDEYQRARFDNYRQTPLKDESSAGDEGEIDSYAHRVNTAYDFARTESDPDYYATSERVQAAIDDLDEFLTSKDLPKLIDLKKTLEDGTQVPYTKLNSEEEVENLSELIDAVLRERLFSDDLMNTLVDLLYGSISRLLGFQLGNLLFDTSGAGEQKWDPLDLYVLGSMLGENGTNVIPLNLSGDEGIYSYSVESVSVDGGSVELYLNGKNGTKTLKDLFSSLGVNIYPEQLANSLGAYPEIQQKLRAAANWKPAYVESAATAQSRSDYNKYMGPIYGDWTAVDLSNGEVYTEVENGGYNPYLYEYDEASDSYKLKFEWGIDGDYEKFVNVLGIILESIKPLLQVVLCGKENYSQTIGNDAIALNATDATITINNAKASAIYILNFSMQYTQAAIDLTGTAGGTLALSIKNEKGDVLKGFNDLLGPIYEALGISDYVYKTEGFALNGNLSPDATGEQMAHAILDPLNELIKQITNHPLDKILSILPNVAFSLSFDLLQPLIDQINIDIVFTLGIGTVNIGDVEVLDSSWPNWLVQILINLLKGTLANALRDNLKPEIPVSIALGDMLQLSELLGVDITDLNAILMNFLGNSENPAIAGLISSIPTMNTAILGTLGVLLGQSGSGTTPPSSIRTQGRYGLNAGQRYSIESDKADVFWFILSYLGEALGNPDFRDVILGLIRGAEEEEEGTPAESGEAAGGLDMNTILNTILGNVTTDPEALPLALVEIFEPYMAEDGQQSGYGVQPYKWWSEETGANQGMEGLSAASYLYLQYGNDWTYAKARTFYEDADRIITNLLQDQIQAEKDENGNPVYNSFGQWLQSLVDQAFSAQAIETVLRGLSRLGNLSVMDNAQLKYIISRFPDKTGMSLKLWADSFGYYFYTEEDAQDEGILPPEAPAVISGPDGYSISNVESEIFGKNMFSRIAYKENPARTAQDIEENVANQFLWMFNMDETGNNPDWVLIGEVAKNADGTVKYTRRQIFQAALEYVLEGFMPAVDVFFSGKAGKLFSQDKWDETDTSTLLTIPGNNGYDNALVPLFEAIGINKSSDYILEGNPNAPVASFEWLTQSEFDALGENRVSYLFNMVFGFVEALSQNDQAAIDAGAVDENEIGAYDHLIQNVLTIVVPGLLYFIESNGLSTFILNLLKPVLTLVDDLLPVLGLNTVEYNVTTLLDTIAVPLLNNLFGYEEGSENAIETIGLNLKDLSFHKIAKIIENVTNLNLDPLTYGVDAICAVDRTKVPSSSTASVADGEAGYRYTFSDLPEGVEANGKNGYNDPANVITVLLSLVIDILETDSRIPEKSNIDVLIGLIQSVSGGIEGFDEILNLLPSLIETIMQLGLSEAWTMEPDWFYFDTSGDAPSTVAESVPYRPGTPTSTIYFLRYSGSFLNPSNLWYRDSENNEDLPTYISENLSVLVDTVISLVSEDENINGLGDFVKNLLDNGGFLTDKTINDLAKTLRELIGDSLDRFSDLLNIFLGFDVSYWSEEKYPVIEKGEETPLSLTAFGQALLTLLAPLDNLNEGEYGILTWMLSGKPMAFFHSYKTTGGYTSYVVSDRPENYGDVRDLIYIPGGQGYRYGIVPLFEALGFELPKREDGEYKYIVDQATGRVYLNSEETGEDAEMVYASGIEILSDVILSLLTQVEGWMEDGKLIDAVLDRALNFIYFLNANGLVTSIVNLLAPLAPLANTLAPLLPVELDIPEQDTENNESNVEYEQRKLIAIIDSLLKSFIPEETFTLPENFTVANLDLFHIFELLKEAVGIDINGALEADFKYADADGTVHEAGRFNYVKEFFLGELHLRPSANGGTSFRMEYTDQETKADMVTILLYTVMDVLNDAINPESETGNRDFLVDLLGSAEILDTVYSVFNLTVTQYYEYDWLYTVDDENGVPQLDPAYENVYVSPLDRVSAISGTSGYDRYWTKDMAMYVADNLTDVVNNTLLLLGLDLGIPGGTIQSIDQLIEVVLPGGLYTNANIAAIAGAVLGLTAQLDEIDPDGVIRDLLKAALKVDLMALKDYENMLEAYEAGTGNFGFTDGDRNGFVNALAGLLRPVYPLLRWLLLDESISLFFKPDLSDMIKLPGGKGYEQSIIPIFESILPADANIKTLAEYKADIERNPDAILTDILNPLLDFVDAALADPLNVILERIPAIVYFINSKGIDTAIHNLLHPVYDVLVAVKSLVDIDIDATIQGFIGFSLDEFDFNALVELAINNLLPEELSSLKTLVLDVVNELTIGKVIEKESRSTYVSAAGTEYKHYFTVVLASSVSDSGAPINVNGSQNATVADLITVLLRVALRWLTLPENQPVVREFLTNNISDENVRQYVLAAYGEAGAGSPTGLVGFLPQPYGVSMMMGLVYYVFFAWDSASAGAIGLAGSAGKYWQYVSGTLASSNQAYIQTFANYITELIQRAGGANPGVNPDPDDGNDPVIVLSFFQRIIKWLQDLFARIRSLFSW